VATSFDDAIKNTIDSLIEKEGRRGDYNKSFDSLN